MFLMLWHDKNEVLHMEKQDSSDSATKVAERLLLQGSFGEVRNIRIIYGQEISMRDLLQMHND